VLLRVAGIKVLSELSVRKLRRIKASRQASKDAIVWRMRSLSGDVSCWSSAESWGKRDNARTAACKSALTWIRSPESGSSKQRETWLR